MKEVIFKCIHSAPPPTSSCPPPKLSPLPILSFYISLINRQITAVTAAPLFCPGGKHFKMNLNRAGPGNTFRIMRVGFMQHPKEEKWIADDRVLAPSPAGRTKASKTRQALAMHASQLPWLGGVDSERGRGAHEERGASSILRIHLDRG